MATKKINTRIKLRVDNASNWTGSTVKIVKGEAALSLDTSTNKYKLKFGTTDSGLTWGQLSENLLIPAENVIGLGDALYDYQLVEKNPESGVDGQYTLQKKLHSGTGTWEDVTSVQLATEGKYNKTTNKLTTKTWVESEIESAIDYYEPRYFEGTRTGTQTDQQVIAAGTSGKVVTAGSTFVIKTAIGTTGKYEYTTFFYDDKAEPKTWKPIDSLYAASNVYCSDGSDVESYVDNIVTVESLGTNNTVVKSVSQNESGKIVVVESDLLISDIIGLPSELSSKQESLYFTDVLSGWESVPYNKDTNQVALKNYVDVVAEDLSLLKDVQSTTDGSKTQVVNGVTVNTDGKLAVSYSSVTESQLDAQLARKINTATSALHFIGVATGIIESEGKYTQDPHPESVPESEWITANSGDVLLHGYKEYVAYEDKTSEVESGKGQIRFAELGDENLYLTKDEAISTYETIANCDSIRNRLTAVESEQHWHTNKSTLDAITVDVKTGYDKAVLKANTVESYADKIADGNNNGEIIRYFIDLSGKESTETIKVYDESAVLKSISEIDKSIGLINESVVALRESIESLRDRIESLSEDVDKKLDKREVYESTFEGFYRYAVNLDTGAVEGYKAVVKSDLTSIIKVVESTSETDVGLMTGAMAAKLHGIEAGAQVNVIEKVVDANDVEFTITNKAVKLDQIILDGGSATVAVPLS